MKKLIPSMHDIQHSFEKVANQLNEINNDELLEDLKTRTKKYAQQAQEAFKLQEKNLQKMKQSVTDKKKGSSVTNDTNTQTQSMSSNDRIEFLMTYLRGGYDVKTGEYAS